MLSQQLRIGIFMDGNFLEHVNRYYYYGHYNNTSKNIDYQGLFDYLRHKISTHEDILPHHCHIVESHWFRGRFSNKDLQVRYPEAEKRLRQMTFERGQLDFFTKMGIVVHNTPLSVNRATGKFFEKGVDVWLSLEALEQSFLKRFDVLVLVAGDGDYLPLVRKLNGHGTRVMVVGWDVEYIDAYQQERNIRTNQLLLEEAAYSVILNTVLGNEAYQDDPLVQGILRN